MKTAVIVQKLHVGVSLGVIGVMHTIIFAVEFQRRHSIKLA